MYYDDIVPIVRKANENGIKVFVAETINGNEVPYFLTVKEDEYCPLPFNITENTILPWFIARDFLSLTPANEWIPKNEPEPNPVADAVISDILREAEEQSK